MTDKETSLEFVERMESVEIPSHSVLIERKDFLLLRHLAKTAALIDEHKLWVEPPIGPSTWRIVGRAPIQYDHKDIHTAVRSVADKIRKEQA